MALQERSQGKARNHIPYRNSMMTSVLRDSIGGNCQTVRISPKQNSYPCCKLCFLHSVQLMGTIMESTPNIFSLLMHILSIFVHMPNLLSWCILCLSFLLLQVMIATVSIAQDQLEETISTCRFAQRVATISNEVWIIIMYIFYWLIILVCVYSLLSLDVHAGPPKWGDRSKPCYKKA